MKKTPKHLWPCRVVFQIQSKKKENIHYKSHKKNTTINYRASVTVVHSSQICYAPSSVSSVCGQDGQVAIILQWAPHTKKRTKEQQSWLLDFTAVRCRRNLYSFHRGMTSFLWRSTTMTWHTCRLSLSTCEWEMNLVEGEQQVGFPSCPFAEEMWEPHSDPVPHPLLLCFSTEMHSPGSIYVKIPGQRLTWNTRKRSRSPLCWTWQ